jgi:hypothetical protein
MAEPKTPDPCSVPGSEFTPACSGPVFDSTPYVTTGRVTERTADSGTPLSTFVVIAIIAALYFIPYLTAHKRRVKHLTAIGLLNLAFGWTVIGWFAALIWALVDPSLLGTTTCPFCAETIKTQARVCPHCRHDLTPIELRPA